MSLKNSSDTIGNGIRDLPACSAVPQPLRPRVLIYIRIYIYIYIFTNDAAHRIRPAGRELDTPGLAFLPGSSRVKISNCILAVNRFLLSPFFISHFPSCRL
jgi:hypothetical protein